MNRARLIKKAELIYRKYRAIMILTNELTPQEREKIDYNLQIIPKLPSDKIRDRLPKIEKQTRELGDRFGVIGTLDELERSANFEHDGRPILFVAKFHLERLFVHYERRLPIFPKLPPHAKVGIELQGVRDKGKLEVFLLEASLFEDLALLWNTTLEISESLETEYSMERKKQRNALNRATAKAAFNLLEGYLNGMALDVHLTQEVTPKQISLLAEWDEKRSRSKFMSLRDKLLQYPRIALGKPHPPLDETNCPEMEKILDMEQRVRHALIHPTPALKDREPHDARETVYIQLTMPEIAELCDMVVELIDKLNSTVQEKFGTVQFWLRRRDATGKFPSEAFT